MTKTQTAPQLLTSLTREELLLIKDKLATAGARIVEAHGDDESGLYWELHDIGLDEVLDLLELRYH